MELVKSDKDKIVFEMHDKDAPGILYKIGTLAYHFAKTGENYAMFAPDNHSRHQEILDGIFPPDAGFWHGPAALYLDYIGSKKVKAFIEERAIHSTEPKALYVFYTSGLDEVQGKGAGKEIFDSVLREYQKNSI